VLLSGDSDRIELAATDTEISIRAPVEGRIEEPGAMLVPGRLMADIVRSLDSDSVTIEHRVEQGDVEIRAGASRFGLKSLPAEDFPRLPEQVEEGGTRVPAKAFARTIERVAKAASRDETRPVLTGILVSVGDGELQMVATDSYRLSVKNTPLEGRAEPFEANVPARALGELSRVVADVSAEELTVAMRDNQIVFGADGVVLSSRMIEGQFPNYRQLLPESYEHEVRIDRGELLSVVRRVSLMAQRNAPLRLRFEDGALTVSAQTPDVGEAAETIPVPFSGDVLEIGFNPQFLQDGVEGVEFDEVVLRLISPLRPGLIEGAEDSDEKSRFLYLIMPVRLNV
jgi:DNA polymerase-3 subunit beta